jgi:HAD superfamily hydrolase (TIGR01456 family)
MTTKKGIALDIDGVVLRGGKLIPGAKETIQKMVKEKVPFIFITNGGGVTEEEKATGLSEKLEITVSSDQILLCHTPFRALVNKYRKSPVLIIGNPSCLNVAKAYGFEQAYDTTFFFDNSPGLLAVRKHPNYGNSDVASHLPLQPLPTIEATFIFDDSPDWLLDMQILSDILVSTKSSASASSSHPAKYQRVPVFASNADIVYATDYSLPRFTQGAFVESFRHLFQLYHHIPLEVTYYGKPYDIQYKYAEEMIAKQSEKLGYSSLPLVYYGVGDNPKSDIQGANAAGDHWHSILVKTGLYQTKGEVDNDHEHPADHVCHSIVEAVDYLLRLEV